MFDGLTMVSYDGHNRNKMMVDYVWTMVDHGRPWSGGQMFAGATQSFCASLGQLSALCNFVCFPAYFLHQLSIIMDADRELLMIFHGQ